MPEHPQCPPQRVNTGRLASKRTGPARVTGSTRCLPATLLAQHGPGARVQSAPDRRQAHSLPGAPPAGRNLGCVTATGLRALVPLLHLITLLSGLLFHAHATGLLQRRHRQVASRRRSALETSSVLAHVGGDALRQAGPTACSGEAAQQSETSWRVAMAAMRVFPYATTGMLRIVLGPGSQYDRGMERWPSG